MIVTSKKAWLNSVFTTLKLSNDWISLENHPAGSSANLPFPTTEEVNLTASMGKKRKIEFLIGRQLIQQAFLQLNYPRTPLLIGMNNEPLWPDQLTGSITHHKGNVWVIVTKKPLLIGIDLEATGRLNQNLWHKVLTEQELEWIQQLSIPQQIAFATLIFSAKEAYFKMQFPKTKEKLTFLDGCIEMTQVNFGALNSKEIYGEWQIKIPKATLSKAQGYFWIDEQKTYTITIG